MRWLVFLVGAIGLCPFVNLSSASHILIDLGLTPNLALCVMYLYPIMMYLSSKILELCNPELYIYCIL